MKTWKIDYTTHELLMNMPMAEFRNYMFEFFKHYDDRLVVNTDGFYTLTSHEMLILSRTKQFSVKETRLLLEFKRLSYANKNVPRTMKRTKLVDLLNLSENTSLTYLRVAIERLINKINFNKYINLQITSMKETKSFFWDIKHNKVKNFIFSIHAVKLFPATDEEFANDYPQLKSRVKEVVFEQPNLVTRSSNNNNKIKSNVKSKVEIPTIGATDNNVEWSLDDIVESVTTIVTEKVVKPIKKQWTLEEILSSKS